MRRIGIARAAWAGTLVLALVGGRVEAEDARQAFEGLFGDKASKVAASADKKDDAELAKEILEAVDEVGDSPGLQILLCEKAYEFGIRDRRGYAVAAGAMKRMLELAPDRRAEAENRLLDLYTLQFRRSTGEDKRRVAEPLLEQLMILAGRHRRAGKADEALALYRRASTVASYVASPRKKEILEQIRNTLGERKVLREIERLESALKDKPGRQPLAERLLMLYLVERDEPHKAVSLLGAAQADEHFKTYVPLAAGDPNQVASDVCTELGLWYEGLADKAHAAASKKNMLLRARTYYARFLKLHTKKDAAALKARLALDRVDKGLEKLTGKIAVRNVAGLLWATVDDRCELRINGKPVMQADIRSRQSAKAALNPGDLITVKLLDTGGANGFCFVFQGEDPDVEFSSDTQSWFIYAPTAAKAWWKTKPSRKARPARPGGNRGVRADAIRMAPRPLQTPCETIWGQGRQCYLYHVVTGDELRGRGLKCVSTDAAYTVSSTHLRQRPLPTLLTGTGRLHHGEYAFHTQRQANPCIVITLKKAFPIKRIVIENRRNRRLHNRARGLTVWLSTDGERWKGVWTAKKARPLWRIELKKPVRARYVKIGLRRTDFLHLSGVRIYAR